MGFLDWLARVLGGAPPEEGAPRRSLFAGLVAPPRERRQKLRATAEHDAERLAAQGLPSVRYRDELAGAMRISRGALDWLTFADHDGEPLHYVSFAVPKSTGGYRVLYAPKVRMKQAQRWIHEKISGDFVTNLPDCIEDDQ